MKDILCFQDENRWLSNFWPAEVGLDGVIYPTVKNAYQASKTTPENRNLFKNCRPGEAKRLGRQVPLRPEWDALEAMQNFVWQKYDFGNTLGAKLVNTGTCHIEEGNAWGDTFWGVCRGQGQNILGKLIMERRQLLQTVGGNS